MRKKCQHSSCLLRIVNTFLNNTLPKGFILTSLTNLREPSIPTRCWSTSTFWTASTTTTRVATAKVSAIGDPSGNQHQMTTHSKHGIFKTQGIHGLIIAIYHSTSVAEALNLHILLMPWDKNPHHYIKMIHGTTHLFHHIRNLWALNIFLRSSTMWW